ncbi:MAG: uncharacterized protein QOK11_894 [Pseudonocardiales bacterium]|nr:uncharacterized protein [Pseudonocardiales bacterium]
MTLPARDPVGAVVTLWRYPVKSMLGEELDSSTVTERGLLGDRSYALVDSSDGKVASAKNPRKWPRMLEFRAALAADADRGGSPPGVRITLPDGDSVTSSQADHDERLSRALDRAVTLEAAEPSDHQPDAAPSQARVGTAEEYWPDMEDLDYRDTVTDFDLPEGTFFDAAAVHVLTAATLDQLREFSPGGRFEVRRFRPNIVVDTSDRSSGFAEDAWIGHTIQIGDQVRLSITGPCSRCVMTTLAQADLPKDSGILRTAAQHHGVNVGVYASVAHGGTIRRGDPIWLD